MRPENTLTPETIVWTDYPFKELGDTLGAFAPVRQVTYLSYDNNKYATIRLPNEEITEVKKGYLSTSKNALLLERASWVLFSISYKSPCPCCGKRIRPRYTLPIDEQHKKDCKLMRLNVRLSQKIPSLIEGQLLRRFLLLLQEITQVPNCFQCKGHTRSAKLSLARKHHVSDCHTIETLHWFETWISE